MKEADILWVLETFTQKDSLEIDLFLWLLIISNSNEKKKGSNLFSSLPLISHLSCEGTVFHCLAKWTIMPPSIRPKPKWPLTDKPALFFTQNPPVSGFPPGACLALLTIMCCTSRHVREGLKNQTQ